MVARTRFRKGHLALIPFISSPFRLPPRQQRRLLAKQGDEWEEKWGERYGSAGWANKYADKWAKDGPNVWHERWGEDYDGTGGCVKYTDKARCSCRRAMWVIRAFGLHQAYSTATSSRHAVSWSCIAGTVKYNEYTCVASSLLRMTICINLFRDVQTQWAERLMEGGGNEQWGENWVEDFKSGAGSKKVGPSDCCVLVTQAACLHSALVLPESSLKNLAHCWLPASGLSERFHSAKVGIGSIPSANLQGETWSVNGYGDRYQRWWGENHHGNGWVQRWGNSTTGVSATAPMSNSSTSLQDQCANHRNYRQPSLHAMSVAAHAAHSLRKADWYVPQAAVLPAGCLLRRSPPYAHSAAGLYSNSSQ